LDAQNKNKLNSTNYENEITSIESFTVVFATQIQAQNRTSVNAMNSEISDNLDLRAVASILETLEIFKILNDG
jgi:hypothetical protein